MVIICISFSLTSPFKYNGLPYKDPFMSASSSSDVHLLVFTRVVGRVYSDAWEKHTAAIFRVT
jgi:hypothetical protein